VCRHVQIWLKRAHDCYSQEYDNNQALETLNWSSLLLVWTENKSIKDTQNKSETKTSTQGKVVVSKWLSILVLLLVRKELGLW
jgi:hypothetical protein